MQINSYNLLTAAFCAALTGVTAGCASIKSTMLTRDESNSSWQCIETCGVPITVKVPTHLKVQIQETRYLTYDTTNGTWSPLTDCGSPIIALNVQHDFIRTEKIFMVDLKRPAAGVLDYTAKFDNQSITEITSHIEDRTISDVSQAIQGILKAARGAGVSSGQAPAVSPVPLQQINSVRAVGIFEFDDPTWELQLTQFLEQHLGNCAMPKDGAPVVLGETAKQPLAHHHPFDSKHVRFAPPVPPASPGELPGSERRPNSGPVRISLNGPTVETR
jgi:hypothetical protein